MKKTEKRFDAVQMMRGIRDKLSEQFKDMSFEGQKRYMKERLSAKGTLTQQSESVTHSTSL